ncbi:ATP-dependent RNA helicase DDX42 [Nymphon striatum]|nr:ATP-dependent RNA helicase DDX42 [Nymphon striatum]
MYHRGGDGKSRGFGFSGFTLGGRSGSSSGGAAIPPPASLKSSSIPVNSKGYAGLQAISQNAIHENFNVNRRRPKTEEEYFESDDEEEKPPSELEYIPAPGSPTAAGNNSESEEDDPLDAFMAGIEKEVEKNDQPKPIVKKRGVRDDIDYEDDEESYYRYMEENPNAGRDLTEDDSDLEIEYDEDGNPIAPPKSKYIDPLPPMDHSNITYETFEKYFYQESEDIATLTETEVDELRDKLGLKVTGPAPPKPVTSFAHFGFDEALMKAIRKSEYTQPTPIQSQAIPIGLTGRDVIGIAKTGSGKTAAFVWPMLCHIKDQRELKEGEGPIGIILAPTRELSQQIYMEAKKFGKVYNIRVVCCYGGGSKWEQSLALAEGAEIIVATPGRMIDMVKMKATSLNRVTFLVLDEADRMFNMGFEPQVRSICDHVRPDRQTLLFSATFKKKIEKLARDVLTDPIRVVQGDLGEANEDIQQIVKVMTLGGSKFEWLKRRLVELLSSGSVLIFVTKKANAEELAANLRVREFDLVLIHGDMDQIERNKVITAFKKKEVPIMVATDVAARGLDIPHIKTVVNYDIARDIDTHTHRIGRTGRAGEKGMAYTLVTEKDKEFVGHLVRNLESVNQEVSEDLLDLALQSSWFRKSRFKSGKGKKTSVGGQGLGFRERPVLDAPSKMSSTSSVSFGGPQTNRLATMKSAFQNQYKTKFCLASSDTAWQSPAAASTEGSNAWTTSSSALSTVATDKPPKKKKSRWDS